MRDEIKAASRIQKSGVRRKEEPPRCESEPFILNSGFWLLTSAVHPSSLISPCVAQTGGNAVDGRGQRVIQIFVLLTILFAAEERDLNQAHRINVRVA